MLCSVCSVCYSCTGARDDEVSQGVVMEALTVPEVVAVVRPKLSPMVVGGGHTQTTELARKPSVVFPTEVVVTKRVTKGILTGVPTVGVPDSTGTVVLPPDTTEVLGAFLGARLTKKKGHKDSERHFRIWEAFHGSMLGGSTDYFLEHCKDDVERAQVVCMFIKGCVDLELKDKQIGKMVASVRHQFEVAQKPLAFFDNSLVQSMRKALKPSTAQIRAEAIEGAQHVKLPVPCEVIDHMHTVLWEGSDWDWDGTLSRAISTACELSLWTGFRASNMVSPGKDEEDHAVRFSDLVFSLHGDRYQRRVNVSKDLVDIEEDEVISFTAHVYSSKTGRVKGAKVPSTVTRETDLGNKLVKKVFLLAQQMVQSPLFNPDDPMFTVYRLKKDKWFRRLMRRSDLSNSAKDSGEEFDIPREHLASSSFRKAAATNKRLAGGSDGDVAAVGAWALNKHGRSTVAGNHYDLADVTGRQGAVGAPGITVQEMLNMVPLNSTRETKAQSTKKVSTAKGSRKVKKSSKKKALALSPKLYKNKQSKK